MSVSLLEEFITFINLEKITMRVRTCVNHKIDT